MQYRDPPKVMRWCVAVTLLSVAAVSAAERRASVDGFSAPYRVVRVATSETGLIDTIETRPGAYVETGAILVKLNAGLF